MGGDSCSGGRGFESWYCILDGYNCFHIYLLSEMECLFDKTKINKKEAEDGLFYKKTYRLCFLCSSFYCTNYYSDDVVSLLSDENPLELQDGQTSSSGGRSDVFRTLLFMQIAFVALMRKRWERSRKNASGNVPTYLHLSSVQKLISMFSELTKTYLYSLLSGETFRSEKVNTI